MPILEEGRRLGPYVITRLVGKGGMGEVYLAGDSRLERKVAIKVLTLPPCDDFTGGIESLRREARAASQLNHPNILTVYDFGQEDGLQYMVSEFVEGISLREKIGQLSAAEAMDYALQVGHALEAAHAAGITHRDIKPENVMLRADGYIKVLDYGLAKFSLPQLPDGQSLYKRLSNTSTKSIPGLLMGTVDYMSPEQIRGQSIDLRTDIWSWGILLYEMVAGKRPFEAPTILDVMAGILNQAPATLNHGKKLQGLVARALSKQPEERYQSMSEALADLAGIPLSSTTSDRRSLIAPAPAPEAKRHKLAVKPLAFSATVIVMVAASAFGLYRMLHGHTEAPTPFSSMSITKLTDSGNVYSAAISPDGKYIVHVIRENDKQSLWLRHIPTGSNTQVIPPINETFIGLTFSRDGNYFYFVRSDKNHPGAYYLFRAPVLGGNPHMVTADVETAISFSPDGSAMAFLRNNPQTRQVNLMIANSDGSGERVLAARNAPDIFGGPPDWSPDGKSVAVHSFTANGIGSLQTIDVVSGRTNEVASVERSSSSRIEILPVRWMPDGKGLVIAYHSQAKGVLHLQIGYVAYPSGKLSQVTNDLNDYSRWALSVTSDGKSLVTVQSERTFRLWTMPAEGNGAARAQQIGEDKDEGLALAWTRDGHIVTNHDKSNFVLRQADGTNKATVYSARVPAYGATVCGNYLVMAGGEEGKGRNIFRADLSRGIMKQLTFGEWNASPACSPDGQWIVYASSDTAKQGIFKVHIDGGAAQKIIGLEGYAPTFSPDGKLVAFAYYGSTDPENWRWKIVVISANGGAPLQAFEASRGGARRFLFEEPFGKIQFTADGTGLIYPIYDGEADNLWIQPLSGMLRKLTSFKSGLIEDYAASPDGKSVALLRGQLDRDVVQIKDAADR